ncbi:cation:proton antiporter [candidate division WOR-3 bacterium]|uniref:Cation:proton antiporter n=1 Tax=candidate division WOR-3 bacterium TaxID=2052148 RepID=A0A660SM21_UNCW3|nr:MAG: cation:proton antiporter [candidate division WOR-3 bacterium]
MIVMISFLALCAFLCFYRILLGPTISDRMVAVDIMGIIFVGITALMAVLFKLPYLLDLAIALTILSFIGVLALAKYLGKRRLDD